MSEADAHELRRRRVERRPLGGPTTALAPRGTGVQDDDGASSATTSTGPQAREPTSTEAVRRNGARAVATCA
ncbi:hypothetical protein [Streptomyces sp. NEAU-W12]|uniref:hypothetical protein n=1 Tax=Streptomyces sp. NEAU-W12 TaxID=2994668 RepID=UPI00224B8521|nr:hypothetical protein [Streptomyces sp. NEAU-W12]MCX2926150.1 hypothetical protein [Streptomyces sp. NEAU-W12]